MPPFWRVENYVGLDSTSPRDIHHPPTLICSLQHSATVKHKLWDLGLGGSAVHRLLRSFGLALCSYSIPHCRMLRTCINNMRPLRFATAVGVSGPVAAPVLHKKLLHLLAEWLRSVLRIQARLQGLPEVTQSACNVNLQHKPQQCGERQA